MIQPAWLPIVAHRWVPFKYQIAFQGIDLTGATFAMSVRSTRDATSAAVTLANAASPSEGISVSVATALGVTTSTIELRIVEASMEDPAKFPLAPAIGDDLVYFYDIHITPSGGTKAVYFEGSFTVKGGATQ